jgi:hypothetical protein
MPLLIINITPPLMPFIFALIRCKALVFTAAVAEGKNPKVLAFILMAGRL